MKQAKVKDEEKKKKKKKEKKEDDEKEIRERNRPGALLHSFSLHNSIFLFGAAVRYAHSLN